MIAITPATPPATHRQQLFGAVRHAQRIEHSAMGVSRPTRCPAKIISTPTWNSTDPIMSCLRRSSWLDPARQL
jgi:hypothetical protein